MFANFKKGSIVRKSNSGFTLVEMVVTIGIFLTITAIVLANFPAYGNKLSLGRIAREMALLFRQAQVYGIAVKEIQVSGGTQQTPPFGIYFNTDRPKQFVFFSDTGIPGNQNNRYVYDEGRGCRNLIESECEEAFNLDGKEYIKSIEVGGVYPTTAEDPSAELHEITVMFKRPDPDAIFVVDGIERPDINFITIIVKSVNFPDRQKGIRIWNTGQIAVID